ncbi:type VI secretion system Vgr family protein [Variovorax paradoxus]|jgi:type VI secretion system secreted protein VgrG|uniref:type VI secretion system Vgr family protein n=1 Tax=Variovorax paradoxus TaxID=34073 RepID=UPI002480066A|nr:type VI secretion system tip protein TssI/VgrG [Variovorax paradoxus]WGT64102.1 type VI secretion system tip protein TssI/VgrG [Variovorax paradoxus]
MANRIVKAHTPLAEDQLIFRSMHGAEGLSQLFEFEVDLLSPSVSLDMKSVLGKPLSLEIQTVGEPRFLNGQIVRFTMVGRESSTSRYVVYRATVRPWLWYLTRTSDCKIFQNKSVVDILDEVFADYKFAVEKKLSGSYRQWEYCVQYQETDFAFVSRLMEHEGIYYYFKHEKNQHTLVLADDIGAHETLPGYPKISYLAADRDPDPFQEVIDQWQVTEEIRPGTYVVDDYDFKKSKADLMGMRSQPRGNPHDTYEIYEWLGGFSEVEQGEHYSRIRLEEAQSQAERDVGHSSVRGMAPGYRFTMQNCPRQDDNREYLIVSVAYALREGGYESGAADSHYSFSFAVQPTSYPFRPPRVTPMTRTNGPQTATVVGKAGQEYWVDQYGRVKVQFRWDRYGKSDENSSCWVRVSSAWAGSNYGAVNHPRKGQEVIVDFIGGHPDRPIIIGRVYNSDQMPPLELPAKVTVSGFVSRSQDGTPANANEFILDDAPGSELVRIHAEKNFELDVEADEADTVAGKRTTTIEGADKYTTNTSLDETVNGPHTLTVNKGGPQKITVNGGDQFIKVDGGNQQVDVIGNQTIHVTGKRKDTVDSGEERIIGTSLKEDIDGPQTTKVVGLYTEDTKGKKVTVDGDEDYLVKGAQKVHANTSLNATTDGPMNLESTKSDITVKSPTKIVLDAPHVEDKSAKKVTFTDWGIAFKGFNMGINGMTVSINGVAVFANVAVISVAAQNLGFNAYSITGAINKFDMYSASGAVGLFTTTQTVFTADNKATKIDLSQIKVNPRGITVYL